MSERSIVQVTLWNSPYLGNFMECELLAAQAVSERLGLRTHFVLAPGAEGQPWLAELDERGVTWSVPTHARTSMRSHLARVGTEHDAALVHTHFTAADLSAAAVAAAAHLPCVWHVRTGLTHISPTQRLKDLLKWRTITRLRVAEIIAVSPWLAELVRRRGAPVDRIRVLPDPIILDRFARMPDRAAARRRFDLRDDATVVLGLGWWPQVKGVDVLTDALERVAPLHHDMQLLLVGEQEMETFLDGHLHARPAWLRTAGFVDDAAWLYAAADIFVSASRAEGQSTAIGEAIACGLPVIMSDIPGTSGWSAAPQVSTFASADAAALAGELERSLAAEPPAPARARAGAENRRWAHANMAPARWAEQRCAVYERVLERAPAASVRAA